MRIVLEDGSMEGMSTKEDFTKRKENPVRDDVRRMAYVKMVMRELGMDQEEAEEYVDETGLNEVINMFQKKDPDKMEKNFETIRSSMGKMRGLSKEIDNE